MSLSDLASLSKVMELADASVEYGQPCTNSIVFWMPFQRRLDSNKKKDTITLLVGTFHKSWENECYPCCCNWFKVELCRKLCTFVLSKALEYGVSRALASTNVLGPVQYVDLPAVETVALFTEDPGRLIRIWWHNNLQLFFMSDFGSVHWITHNTEQGLGRFSKLWSAYTRTDLNEPTDYCDVRTTMLFHDI